MILTKDTAVLGYPGEVSCPVSADHHDVCKFDSPEDHGYKRICAVLSSLVTEFQDESTLMEFLQPQFFHAF